MFNASHVDLMTEINVYKTVRQKIYIVFYNINCSKSSNVWTAPSHKSVYFGISKLILYFPYFMYHILSVLFTAYFHSAISVFCASIYAFFVIDPTRKQMLLIKWFNYAFTKDLPSISQSNVQAVKSEKTE